MGVFKSIAASVGIGESPAEKAKKKAKRAEQAATEKRTKAAEVVTKRKEDAQAQASKEGKGAAASKLALISTSSQGVLDQASTGRRKLFGN